MKFKKSVISITVITTILVNTLSVFAGTTSFHNAWNQLSSSQKSKLNQAGIYEASLDKLSQTAEDNKHLSSFFSPPLSYENNKFILSETNTNQVINLLSIKTDKDLDRNKLVNNFKDLIEDINANSSVENKDSFHNVLSQYGISTSNENNESPAGNNNNHNTEDDQATKPKDQFFDDLEGFDWAKKEINYLASKGYIAGKEENKYGPKDNITRAEFAILICRILDLPPANIENRFIDLNQDAWYYNDTMATINSKLFVGKTSDTFSPHGNISRQEVAAVVSRILVQNGYLEPKNVTSEKSIWAPGALALLNELNIVESITDFNDKVNESANRAEVAYILYNVLEHI